MFLRENLRDLRAKNQPCEKTAWAKKPRGRKNRVGDHKGTPLPITVRKTSWEKTMQKKIDLKLTPAEAADPLAIKTAAALCTGWAEAEIVVVPLRKSIDARSRQPYILLQVEVFCNETPENEPPVLANLCDVTNSASVIIIGAGPAGYFAALELIAQGLKPIILERGKDVQARRRDLKAIQQDGIVNPNSNYCFGEGGAGTYSDGKLYTRSIKRGDWWKSLKILVEHGANPDILVEAHPHIGSNKLPIIVAEIRKYAAD